ncbi:UNVERIFIED_CONTAM: hypothetical protein Sradi_4837800 [Sesamum radiatum]|uniref:Zinc knuckle CX2CX4HX4C domain-containing protein n=1 Tax=Sesamum radiatum TaxID=300843 RepID=A0AAW2MY19_SESRA
MTREAAEDIGDRLGTFMDFDQAQSWGASIRIRVSLDVRVPLRRCLRIKSAGQELTTALTYEHLPNFYYICGILGHIMRDCPSAMGGKGTEGGEDLQYGAWLRESRTVRVSFPSYRGSEGGLWGSHQGQRGRRGTSIFDFSPQNSKVMEQRPDSGGGLAASVTSVVDEGGPRTTAWQLTPQGNLESWRGNFGSGCKVAGNLEETTICENPRSAKQLGQERIPNIPSPYQELSSIQTVGPATIRTQPIDFPLAQPEISTPTPSPKSDWPKSNSSWNGAFGPGDLVTVPIAFKAGARGGRRGTGRGHKETERSHPKGYSKRKEGFSGGESSKKKLMLSLGVKGRPHSRQP